MANFTVVGIEDQQQDLFNNPQFFGDLQHGQLFLVSLAPTVPFAPPSNWGNRGIVPPPEQPPAKEDRESVP